MKLKLLTINLHCYAETDVKNKQLIIVNEIMNCNADIIFLQEVAQTHDLKIIKENIKDDNYGYILQNMLKEQSVDYFYYYEPIKMGYGIYDEGVGILSKFPLNNKISKLISKTTDYQNWKSRKVLAYDLNLDNKNIRVATTHFGWTDDLEIFEDQFDLASGVLNENGLAILAGDFNIAGDSKEYEYIMGLGWHDIFSHHKNYVNAITFHGDDVSKSKESRIDYIMTNRKIKLINQSILFKKRRVSDHYGVFAEIEI